MNVKEKNRKEMTLKEKVDALDIRLLNCEQGVENIITNHLYHLNIKVNVTLGGLAFIAIMIAILGVMIATK